MTQAIIMIPNCFFRSLSCAALSAAMGVQSGSAVAQEKLLRNEGVTEQAVVEALTGMDASVSQAAASYSRGFRPTARNDAAKRTIGRVSMLPTVEVGFERDADMLSCPLRPSLPRENFPA